MFYELGSTISPAVSSRRLWQVPAKITTGGFGDEKYDQRIVWPSIPGRLNLLPPLKTTMMSLFLYTFSMLNRSLQANVLRPITKASIRSNKSAHPKSKLSGFGMDCSQSNPPSLSAIIIPVSILFPGSNSNTDAGKSHAYPCNGRHYFTQ
jgi:hypothetical protein